MNHEDSDIFWRTGKVCLITGFMKKKDSLENTRLFSLFVMARSTLSSIIVLSGSPNTLGKVENRWKLCQLVTIKLSNIPVCHALHCLMARNQRLGSPETQGWREQQINDKILHDILLCSYINALPNYHQRLPPAIDGSRYREPQSDVLWERGLKL